MDYIGKELWDQTMLALQDRQLNHIDNPGTLRQMRKGLAVVGFDLEAHINSEEGRRQAENWRNVITYRDEMDPKVLEY